MIDVERQAGLWRAGAEEDWAVARQLVDVGRTRHGLFFAHLALEKALKACVVRQIRDLAPRLHNLVRLAELARLFLPDAQVAILAEMNVFNLEGRYPESLAEPPSQGEAQTIMDRASEVFRWLMSQS